jgi:hypothetical protein
MSSPLSSARPPLRLRAFVAATAVACLCLTAGVSSAGAGQSAAARGVCDDRGPLDGVCDYLAGRQGIAQVAVFNQKTGRSQQLVEGPALQYTASIVKVDILGRWLRRYQKRGVDIPRDIPYSIRFLMTRMIQNSDNAAATALFHFGGGCDALTAFNTHIPMPGTKVACETQDYYGWGNTTTTASDQVDLMRAFAYGRPRVLGQDARDYGLNLMEGVEADQRFGVSCGPWGNSCDPPDYAPPDPDVTVALKNGWKPLPKPACDDPPAQCPWQVNSTGWVQGKGRNYVLTVLTTRNPAGDDPLDGFRYGINTTQGVSRIVWANLG